MAVTPEIHTAAPVSGFVTLWGVTINPSVIVLTTLLTGVLYMLWKAQRDQGRNSFDVFDLLMDRMPDGTRKTSVIKTAFALAFGFSSWVIIDQEIKGVLNDAIFGLYLGTWCASLIAKVVYDKQDPPALPGGKA